MDYHIFRYALGTTNEAKRLAVQKATGTEPICLSVPSGVAAQPMSEEETITGAINRAKAARSQAPEAEIGLGLEGGLTYDEQFTKQWYLISICAAWNGSELFIGKGLAFPIPNQAVQRIQQEQIELGTIIDEWGKTVGSNHRGGAYSLLTDNRVWRSDVFCDAVIAAITPFVSSLYK
ncbi:inosine/xanthosine triphosphatase [Brevibacillus fortis]|uniref:inosine/xanthosine triphosphatase n=1 Tax=Brevibacillus fortis TaxID=2126352 RepID=UPI002E1A9462|nr:inosine/xanthosine triphosphatase [Brevibacillus fortis]